MRQRSSVIFFWCALALILIVRGRAMWALSDGLQNDPDAYRELAEGLQLRGEFCLTWRYVDSGGYRSKDIVAFRPPLYPWILAKGISARSLNFPLWVGGLQLLVGIGTVVLTWLCGRSWNLPYGASYFAGLLVLVDPLLIHQASQVMTETLATFLSIVCIYALPRAMDEKRVGIRSFIAGGLIGLAVLCRPTFLPWAALIVTYLAFQLIRHHGAVRRPILLAAGLSLALLPWAVRNYAAFGKPLLTTTHGGYTFYRANNAEYFEHLRATPYGTTWNTDLFDREWLATRPAIYGTKQKKQELEFDELAYSLGAKAIRNEPGMFLYACLVRLERFYGMMPWQTDPNESARGRWLRYGVGMFYLFEFALAIIGVCTLGSKLFAPPWIWGTLLVISFTLVHTFYWTDMRMRAPVVPVIAMLAAVGAGWVWGRVRPATCSVSQ